MLGFVKWFNSQKGYGFIVGDDNHAEYFVPYSEIKVDGFKELFEGERVEFDPAEDSKARNRAENVRLIIPRRGKAEQTSMKEILEKF